MTTYFVDCDYDEIISSSEYFDRAREVYTFWDYLAETYTKEELISKIIEFQSLCPDTDLDDDYYDYIMDTAHNDNSRFRSVTFSADLMREMGL